jgi:hypothetical protein
MRVLILLALVAVTNACGSEDDGSETRDDASRSDDGSSESEAVESLEGSNAGPADRCRGTVTAGPNPGPLSCRVRVGANPNTTTGEGYITSLTVSGTLDDDSGALNQSLVFLELPQVKTYDELFFLPRMGLFRAGTSGSLEFVDRSQRTLFSGNRGSVTLTAVGPSPDLPGQYLISGSAEWDLTLLNSDVVEGTVAITFEDQY